MLSELQKEMRKQSKQLTGSKDETSEMRKQLKKLTESHNDQSKKLEKLTESLNYLCKQMELHTNGKNGDDSAAPRCCLLRTITSFVFSMVPRENS
jgi:septal ring factor EnvC (AmiA/AmiB activator)